MRIVPSPAAREIILHVVVAVGIVGCILWMLKEQIEARYRDLWLLQRIEKLEDAHKLQHHRIDMLESRPAK